MSVTNKIDKRHLLYPQLTVFSIDLTTAVMVMDVQWAMRLHIDQMHPNCMYHRQWSVSLNIVTFQLHHLIY